MRAHEFSLVTSLSRLIKSFEKKDLIHLIAQKSEPIRSCFRHRRLIEQQHLFLLIV